MDHRFSNEVDRPLRRGFIYCPACVEHCAFHDLKEGAGYR